MTATPVRRAPVLVVDDDIGMQRLLRAVLEANGHQVTVAPTGELALSLAAEAPPSVVVLDFDLAGELNGARVGERLRDRFGPSLPIIVCTSNANIDAFARTVAADAALSKPFRPAALLDAVNRLVTARLDPV